MCQDNRLVHRTLTIDDAFRTVRKALWEGQDIDYFEFHQNRFRRSVERVMQLLPSGSTVLDVGSHYLHQSALLALLGYKVIGMDAPEFACLDSIRQRAEQFGIELYAVQEFDNGRFLLERGESFVDLVLFCEILEHITFNPIRFWHRIYDLLHTPGKIYITTPNSLRLVNLANVIKRAVLLKGIGPDVSSIFTNVTYGHHWKEYSKSELMRYFRSLSPDFHCQINYWHFRPSSPIRSIKDVFRRFSQEWGRLIPCFDEQLEVVVSLNEKTGFTATPPEYI